MYFFCEKSRFTVSFNVFSFYPGVVLTQFTTSGIASLSSEAVADMYISVYQLGFITLINLLWSAPQVSHRGEPWLVKQAETILLLTQAMISYFGNLMH